MCCTLIDSYCGENLIFNEPLDHRDMSLGNTRSLSCFMMLLEHLVALAPQRVGIPLLRKGTRKKLRNISNSVEHVTQTIGDGANALYEWS
jgi:hypothetical protein